MNELQKGIKIEHEHAKSLKKLMSDGRYNLKQAARMIALDHIKEHPRYYSKLEKAGI